MASQTTSTCIISLLLAMVVSMIIHSAPCLASYPSEPSTYLPTETPVVVETKLSDQNEIYHPQFFDGVSPLHPCLNAVANKGGCVAEMYKFRTGQATKLRDVCCKAMLLINDNCWAKVFSYQPFFPALIRSYCTPLLGGHVGGATGKGVGGPLPTPP